MTSATAGTAHHHDAYRESRLGSRRDGPALPALSVRSAALADSVFDDVVLMAGLPLMSSSPFFSGLSWWWAMSVDVRPAQEVWSQAASIAWRTTSGVA